MITKKRLPLILGGFCLLLAADAFAAPYSIAPPPQPQIAQEPVVLKHARPAEFDLAPPEQLLKRPDGVAPQQPHSRRVVASTVPGIR